MTNRKIFIFAVLGAIATNSTCANDLTLYPVQENKIIINRSCEAGSKLEWDEDLLAATGGMKKGDELLVLSPSKSSRVVAGNLSCFIGECRQNYVSIELLGSTTDAIGVVQNNVSEIIQTTPIQIETIDQSECSELFASITFASQPELPKQRKCQRVTLQGDTKLFIGSKAFAQEESEYFTSMVSAQIKQPIKGSIIKIDHGLQPILTLVDNHKNISLLWRKESGICCPSEITLVRSHVDTKGNITFGRAYTAGGQPCGD